MELFLDSSDPQEIMQARSWGLLSGVTTNPSLIAKAGPDMRQTLGRVLEASPGPVLVQVIGWHAVDPLVAQARWLHSFSDRIIVKLPMSTAGIQALLSLKEDRSDLRLAVTAVASISQAYLCGKAGADIVAVFNGPLDQDSDTPVNMVPEIRTIYNHYGFSTRILSCGRFPRIFGKFAEAGTDICTMKIEYLQRLYEHSFTDKRMTGFLDDWQTAFGDQTWPEG
jgi:transaldolase